MEIKRDFSQVQIAANQNIKERDYWLKKLSGEQVRTAFPYDYRLQPRAPRYAAEPVKLKFTGNLFSALTALSKDNDHTLHIILTAALTALLHKYTGHTDIIVGVPIYKKNIAGEFINTVLALRNRVEDNITFKELLLRLRQTVVEANENQDYPFEILVEQLDIEVPGHRCPLFDTALLLETIHDKKHIRDLNPNITFVFAKNSGYIDGQMEFNEILYRRETIRQIGDHFNRLLEQVVTDVNREVSSVELLSPEKKKMLLDDINDTAARYPGDRSIGQLFEDQAERTPDNVALVGVHQLHEGKKLTVHLTYRQLNQKANRLAHFLGEKGTGPDSLVGLLLNRSVDMMIAILGILKSGGAYLPIDPLTPGKRIISMLEDCDISLLLTGTRESEKYSFAALQQLDVIGKPPEKTCGRAQITDLDSLPLLDRSLVDYEKYIKYIGQGMVKNSITIQATRGCPYNCAYCCRVWPKKYVTRSAENIFEEVRLYYNMGVRRFVFIDDIFNLDIKNSSRFFKRIIENKMNIRMQFPSGLRGDILTKEYIGLMVEAGTMGFPLALETASPRLQKLIRKNLDLEKLRVNLEYIIEKHPQVILELHTMLGFPTETEEEAMMTLDFIKRLKWVHFPYIHILKIYSHTDMEKLALQSGIPREAINRSMNLAYHELPDTLPFDRRFVLKYQANFLNNYFLSRERLLHVLPKQMKVLTEDEIVQKYNSYLPVEIKSLEELLSFVNIDIDLLGADKCLDEGAVEVKDLNKKLKNHFPEAAPRADALNVLLLDLSQEFSSENRMLYDVVEQPLGLMYLMTYLNRRFKNRIRGKIARTRIDFDSFEELKQLVEAFQPEVIGIRALTFYKDKFHQTAALLRQWGVDTPIIAGGPYAAIDYETLLQDRHIDLAVLGEGEATFAELIEKIMENGKKLPREEILKTINGIAFLPGNPAQSPPGNSRFGREILMMDQLTGVLAERPVKNVTRTHHPGNLAYAIFTSGSTGKPKGILTTHSNVIRVVKDTNYIDLGETDKILQLSNYSFDGSVFDIYGAFLNGAALVMIEREDIFAAGRLSEIIKKQGITVFFLTTALFNTLVDMGIENIGDIRKMLFGGERVSVQHTRKALDYLGKDRVIHVYGPTETTVYASYYRVNEIDERRETIPIGKPISNTTIYILDNNLMPVPPGAIGQVCVGGAGLARGYLNKPGLTAASFVVNPFKKSRRIYLTGDFGKWLPDGNIEFIGRIDHQLKIRGFRIEPEEIENRLAKVNHIRKALVMEKKRKNGERYLCAYVVPSEEKIGELDTGKLRKLIAEEFPDYMVPSNFVLLDAIPLTPNGKVDRKALPEPEAGGSDESYVPPRSPLEDKCTQIWSDVLGIEKEKIGIDSDFFELGGHSLKATILISKLHKAFNVKILLTALFKTPTIRGLAEHITGLAKESFSSVKAAEEKEYYGLSSAQKRLYVLQRLETDSTGYNIPMALILEKTPDRRRLENAFKELIKRHESLRTSFHLVNDLPVQQVSKTADFEIIDCDTKPGSFHKDEIIRNFIQPFDLSREPLLRVGLKGIPGDKYILVIDMHHIITDGTSMSLFINESLALYAGEELPPLRLQYKDFTEWQHREEQTNVIRRQESYWLNQFEGEIPGLNLPLDYPRPAIQSFAGSVVEFEFSAEQTRALNEVAAAQGTTLYMVLLAVTTILFYKLTHQEDIVIGTPIAARRHVDLERIIGMFVNTLAMRNYPVGGQTFSRFLDQVKENTLRAFENQEYPFEELVEKVAVNRDTSRSPLFDAAFALQNMEMQTGRIPEAAIGDLNIKPYEMESTVSKFDLTLAGVEVEQGLQCSFEYCTALFRRCTIERFSAYFRKIISAVVNEPGIRLKQIEIISEEEKRHLLIDFNDTAAEYPQDKTIRELFARQVEKTPAKIAIVGSRQLAVGSKKKNGEMVQLTYGELNRKSNQFARLLREKGAGPDIIVGIMMERSLDMIIGILGILKAGGAYLPIDAVYPQERIDYMLKDSGAKILLSEVSESSQVSEGTEVVKISELSEHLPTHPTHPTYPTHLCYIIYTSGSTGRPKGVMIEHRSLLNLCSWHNRYYAVTEKDHASQHASYSFDASVWEIFPYLISGAALYIIHRDIKTDIRRLNRFFEKNNITIAFLPTQVCELFITLENRSLRLLLTGGDKLRTYIKRNYRLVNNYGPTENTVVTTSFVLKTDYANIPIGKPVNNTSLYILNKYHQLQPVMVPGELCISGSSLSRGYLNNPELTAGKFIGYRSYRTYISKKLYKTGDLARWLVDGNIEFLGRIDHQAKIRGFRVELGEIEDRLSKHREIKEAVVVKEDTGNDTCLTAYIVPRSNPPVPSTGNYTGADELREYLSCSLPDYMIPTYFVQLEKIPLNPNGKINRKALPKPEHMKPAEYTAPADEIEEKLAEIWSEILLIDKNTISTDANFFELGGHSLKAIQAISRIYQEWGVEYKLITMFKEPTIKKIARSIKAEWESVGKNDEFLMEKIARALARVEELSAAEQGK
jgi:amino acid adenylation domain-containing protein